MKGLPILWTRMAVQLIPMSLYTHTLRVLPTHLGRETVPSGSVGTAGSQGVITSAPVLAVTSDISPDVAPVGTAGWSLCIPTLWTVSTQTVGYAELEWLLVAAWFDLVINADP